MLYVICGIDANDIGELLTFEKVVPSLEEAEKYVRKHAPTWWPIPRRLKQEVVFSKYEKEWKSLPGLRGIIDDAKANNKLICGIWIGGTRVSKVRRAVIPMMVVLACMEGM